jgi:hypothetical protein
MADSKISALTAATVPLAGTEVLPIVQSGTTKKVSISNVTAGRDISASKIIVGTGSEIGRATVWTPTNGDVMAAMRCAGTGTQRGLYVSGDNSTGEVALDVTGSAAGTLVVKTGGTTIAKFDSDWNTQISLGNLKMMTAGKGIDFSANTHAAGMTSELLNAYEEGTWTTTFPNQSNITGTLTLSNGKYTRIGRLVTIEGKFSGNVTALLTLTFFQFTLPIARGATTDSGAGNVITANGLKLGGIENVNADTTTAYVILPSNSGQPTGVDTFLFTYTYSA